MDLSAPMNQLNPILRYHLRSTTEAERQRHVGLNNHLLAILIAKLYSPPPPSWCLVLIMVKLGVFTPSELLLILLFWFSATLLTLQEHSSTFTAGAADSGLKE